MPVITDKAFAKRAGVLEQLPARTAEALSSYKVFGTMSSFDWLYPERDLCDRERWPEKIAAGVEGLVGRGR